MTAKEKQILKKNSKSVLGNTEPRGLEESPPRGSRGDEETEASAPSESEGEGKSTPADEEGRHQEDGDEGETDDEQDSGNSGTCVMAALPQTLCTAETELVGTKGALLGPRRGGGLESADRDSACCSSNHVVRSLCTFCCSLGSSMLHRKLEVAAICLSLAPLVPSSPCLCMPIP